MRYHFHCYRDARKFSGFTAPQRENLRPAAAEYLTISPVASTAPSTVIAEQQHDVLSVVLSGGSMAAAAWASESRKISKDAFSYVKNGAITTVLPWPRAIAFSAWAASKPGLVASAKALPPAAAQ